MSDSHVWDLAIRIATQFYAKRDDLLNGLGWDDAVDVAVFMLGSVVMFICTCRMNRLTPADGMAVGVSYVTLCTGAFALAFAPWLFGDVFVRLGAVAFALAVIVHMAVMAMASNPAAALHCATEDQREKAQP